MNGVFAVLLLAGSPGFAPSADESAGIAKGISSDYSFPDGISFGGSKYAVIRSIPLGDNHSAVLTMKKKESEDEKATGLILTTTNTLVLVAHYDSTERGYTGVVNDALSGLADYLVSSGMQAASLSEACAVSRVRPHRVRADEWRLLVPDGCGGVKEGRE
eukprot:TRINITY_DN58211_c0_g1_i1.p2 TRINITY_DN58211_c0_g1~~TRINITY_DN58211_c0_g1_i1.p2  ORF type:complete len:170 (-),score=50.09 TRINITY_DN58211_c0_g1_i1:192-671(-)